MKVLNLLSAIFLICITANAQNDSSFIHGKIPVDAKRWYQLNNVSNGLEQLFDGELYVRPGTGWGKILSNYDSYYPALDGEYISLDSIKMFDWEGVISNYPVTISVITGTGQHITVATFTGERYNGWDGPYPDRPDVFALDSSIHDVRYIVLNAWYEYPTEIEFYGTYKAPDPVSPVVKKPVKLKDFFGINAFEWDLENPVDPMVIDENRMNAVKNFSMVRHYMDWEKLESHEGSYTFNPVHSGGWNYDTIYQRCKDEGIEILACLKTLPGWMQDTYPEDQRDGENTPVRYGKDFSDPQSYIEQAKVAFQYAARYGGNANVDTTLLSVNAMPRWTADPINEVRRGMNIVHYIECDNERDKWWKGRKAYQTGREYAANLSAFYDGNKNTMGPGVGVKNADTAMQVVMGGLASANTDYVRGMIDWCKENRGYKANGDVDFCWDIINYHYYSNDAASTSNGWPTRGVAPELSGADSVATNFINVAHQYAKDMPVWITEAGYDINDWSPQKAIAIGNKSALQTQADWILRTSLLYARSGIQQLFFYQLYDDNPWGGLYATCGMINQDRTRKPSGDFIRQANKLFGEYTYSETINNDPLVDHYMYNDTAMYALMIPDETNRTATYQLDLGNADSAFVFTPLAGSDTMSCIKLKTDNGKINLTVTETPIFVKAVGVITDSISTMNAFTSSNAVAKAMNAQQTVTAKLYPNPAAGYIVIDGLSQQKMSHLILYNAMGQALQQQFSNSSTVQWSVDNLSAGTYFIVVHNGNAKRSLKFVKE